jgi:hypothetical protein
MIKLHPNNMRALLIQEALRWVGTQEAGGDNKGQIIELFQRSVSLTPGLPWCAAFVHYCLDRVKAQALALDMNAPVSKIHRSGHCLTIWNKTPLANRVDPIDVVPGDLMLWRVKGSDAGHMGIVLTNGHKGSMSTVEANTSPSVEVERNGDGVYIKNRLIGGYGTAEVLGWLRPWL